MATDRAHATQRIFITSLFLNNLIFSQEVENDSTKKTVKVYKLRAGIDLYKPILSRFNSNFEGIELISDYIEDIIEELDSMDKLEFIKAEETKNATPRFKVGLGVMPDYLYNEGGMKISAITSDEKPAGKAGLQKNDIVIKMGDINVIDMMSYMNALSTFKEGDTTTIQIKRDGQIIDFTIKF